MCLPNHCNHLFRWITFHYKQGSISFMFYFLRSRVACSVLYSCSSDNNVSSVVAQQNQNKIDVYNQHTMYSLRLRGSVERGPTTRQWRGWLYFVPHWQIGVATPEVGPGSGQFVSLSNPDKLILETLNTREDPWFTIYQRCNQQHCLNCLHRKECPGPEKRIRCSRKTAKWNKFSHYSESSAP